jgi:hypothetical protein
MPLDFALLWDVATKVLLVGVGALATRMFERRVKLVVFYGHVGAFHLQLQQGLVVHTHTVVIRNNGGLAAINVRAPHIAPPRDAQGQPTCMSPYLRRV